MSFVSYAQCFEDVMLWRALKHVEKGFYIDVGAWLPDADSVTRAFYDRGWSGINVEPNPEFHGQLVERRTRDINLRLAVGDQDEPLEMHFIPNSGLSTLDASIAGTHEKAGWDIEREVVNVTSLDKIWAEHIPDDQPVHFLKVDVEGFEAAVLRGGDWQKNRPWIVVVESTVPMSQVETHGEWESILLDADYCFAYFDGLNRFYVAKEQSGLLGAFNAPPNFFDDMVTYRQYEAERRATEAESRAHDALAHATHAEEQAEEEVQHIRLQMDAMSVGHAEELSTVRGELAAVTEELHCSSERTLWLENEWTSAKAKIDELSGSAHHHWTVAENLRQQLALVQRSKSWQLTAPFRGFVRVGIRSARFCRRLVKTLLKLPRGIVRRCLAAAMRFVWRRPALRTSVHAWLSSFPCLKLHMRAFARQRGILPPLPVNTAVVGSRVSAAVAPETPNYSLDDTIGLKSNYSLYLSPRGKIAFSHLQREIERKQEGYA